MPVFNGEAHVREAIESILTQDFLDFEIVVVDDASTDGTAEILEELAASDERIVVIRNAGNLGIAGALNRGIQSSRAPYVARLDADDLAMPGRLAAQAAVLDVNPEAVLVSCAFEVFEDRTGRKIRSFQMAGDPDVVRWLLLFCNAVGGHGQVMFRRDTVLEIGGYAPGCDTVCDYDLWTRLVRRGTFINLPILGMRYRVHDRNVSHLRRREQLEAAARILQGQLASYLQRELTEHELLSMQHLWHGRVRSGSVAASGRVTREVYRRFAPEVSKSVRRMTRATVATRFVYLGMLCLHRRRFLEAAQHSLWALSWHPVGFIHAIRTVGELLAFRILSRIRQRGGPVMSQQVRARFMHGEE